MDKQENLDVNFRDEYLKSNTKRACLKIRLQESVSIYVPFGQIESFVKMALSSSVDVTILSNENSDLVLD